MTTSGRWSPSKVRQRLLQDSWAFPNSGMVLIRPSSIAFSGVTASITVNGSVSFSAVDSLSLNGVFTSAYDNYMIVVRANSSNDSTAIYYRLRTSGTDASGSNYTNQQLFVTSTTVSAGRTAETFGRIGAISSTTYDRGGYGANIYGPCLAQPTALRSFTTTGYSSTHTRNIDDYGSTHSLSTSYDGVTLYPSQGNFTGLVSVYGLGG